jgi:uncharacterized membrane protein
MSSRRASGDGREVVWPGHSLVLQTVDVPRLLRLAEHGEACVHVCVAPGETIADHCRVAVVLGGRNLADRAVLDALRLGSERTFDQDPAFALRLLADIALRALSPAVNDPTTAVQALDAIADLLRVLVRRRLGIAVVDGADHTPRVVLNLQTWDEYVSVALDEIIGLRISSIQVRGRLDRLIADLLTIAPQQHRAPVERRRAMLSVQRGAAPGDLAS